MNASKRAVTVRVLIHLGTDSHYAVGVVTSEWQGAVKVSRRLSSLRSSLAALVDEQTTDGSRPFLS